MARGSRLRRWFNWLVLMPIVAVAFANFYVIARTSSAACSSVAELDSAHYGLVFGTSHRLRDGDANPFFHNRMKAAAALYHSGKVQRLILSGSAEGAYYNEPREMLKNLEALEVPAEACLLDTSGDRTLASIRQAKQSLQPKRLILVTQDFHCYRALYICHRLGVDAEALVAEGSSSASNWKMHTREAFARPLALIDLHLILDEPDPTELPP